MPGCHAVDVTTHLGAQLAQGVDAHILLDVPSPVQPGQHVCLCDGAQGALQVQAHLLNSLQPPDTCKLAVLSLQLPGNGAM